MTANGITQIVLYLVILTVARVPARRRTWRGSIRARCACRAGSPHPSAASTGSSARARSGAGLEAVRGHGARLHGASSRVLLYALLRLQGHLPLNPDGLAVRQPVGRDEHDRQLRHEHELAVLRRRVHDVVPEPDGRARGAELRLGGARHGRARCGDPRLRAQVGEHASATSGSTSTGRSSTSSCRLPLILAVLLVSQGVVQTFHGAATATTLEGGQQAIARGPAASQIAIKQLGTNGGGFYNSNSAVPFESPNDFTNLLEMLAILLIPVAQVFMFGRMIGSRRQALPVYAAMMIDDGHRHRRCAPRGAARLAGPPGLWREHHRRRRLERRQHVRQGGPLRDRVHRQLGGRDDERLQRLGQRRPRRTHTDGWRRARSRTCSRGR